MRNAIVIIYSRGVLQPSGIRRFGNGVSQLSPLRPVLGNGDPLIEILRNALTDCSVFLPVSVNENYDEGVRRSIKKLNDFHFSEMRRAKMR